MPSIDIEPTKTAIAADDARHVAWLFRQNQPVFLGVVDKDSVSLRIFSLLPIWFLYYRGGQTIGSLSLNRVSTPHKLAMSAFRHRAMS